MSLDTEEPRRKRQRTLSPENQPTILSNREDQLQAAVDGGSRPTIQTERHIRGEDTPGGPGSQRATSDFAGIGSPLGIPVPATEASALPTSVNGKAPMTKTPPKRILRVRSDGKLASPKASAGEPGGLTKGLSSSGASRPQQEPTPPKKILRLRSDGKLSSPKADAATGGTERKARIRISKIGAKVKTSCIAVMKYGADEDGRGSIGRQVNKILSGTGRKPDPQSSKRSDPPKLTHPFFTSKPGRRTDQKPEQPIKTEGRGSQALQASNNCGPRESRIISKPPGTVDVTVAALGPTFPTFGTDYAKATRFPGARDPIWPPCDMLRVGQVSNNIIDRDKLSIGTYMPSSGRKLKDAQIQILPEENILNDLTSLVRLYENNDDEIRKMNSRDTRQFRRPHRKIMTGQELQQAVCSRVASNLPSILPSGSQEEDQLSSSQFSKIPAHKALLHVYNCIPHSRTAFDLFRCETQEWVHKYSPKSAEHVLQQGREVVVLRDWLKGSTISTLESGIGQSRTRDSSAMGSRGGAKAGRKKKRRAKELDGFVVSSDEEVDEMDEITDSQDSSIQSLHERKSVMRAGALRDGQRNANAVVISGPHGCGKTAAVFAVALELGFEIFEVNAGSRRSGKDILDKVGDMTRNHLVKHRQDDEVIHSIEQSLEPEQADERSQAELDSGRQETIESFFQAKSVGTTKQLQEKAKASARTVGIKGKKSSPKKGVLQENISKPRDQKESLILLEEVDVLFEEDKLFWATVIDLITRSKRPVIMTCSDETLLPLDEMALFAILRLAPPPELLATDYLLLVAASEGHLPSREAIQSLYAAKGFDLRASLAELNLYCQMGVGDSKGGLEWMLIDRPARDLRAGESKSFRVISEDTYCSGMGWLSGEDLSRQACCTLDEVVDLNAEVWNGWGLDIGDMNVFAPTEGIQALAISPDDVWHSLQQFDQSCEAFSAADSLPTSMVRHEGSSALDLEQPRLTDKSRCNYVEGRTLLQADPFVDHTGMSESAATALRASARMIGKESNGSAVSISKVIDAVPQMLRHQRSPSQMSNRKLLSAFEPIANQSPAILGVPKGPSVSIFDGPISMVATDVAPYVRAIVSYDLRLEEQRHQLRSLLAQPGATNNKPRTTRASRAALEGGSKANTRRERWFPKNTDFNAVLETGGEEWQGIALQTLLGQSENQDVEVCESRRSSLASDVG